MTRLLEVTTLIGVYGGLLMPLVYARIVIFPFVYLKMLYFQILVGLTFAAWVTLASRDARYRPRASWLLWAVLAWYTAMGLSTLFAANSWRAFFGTQERMTGLFSLLHFLAWYVMAASMLRSSRDWRRLLEVQIGVGFASACAALLQLPFPNLIGSTEVLDGERLSGLLGNPIYVGAYQAFSVYFVIFLWQEASLRRRYWYGLALAASLASFVLAGSRGPLLGLAAGFGAAGLTLALTSRHRRFVRSVAIGAPALVTAYALFVVFVAHRPSLEAFWAAHLNLKHFFDFQIDISRTRLWTAAWAGFLDRPILGWGPAGFEMAFDALYRPGFHTLGIEDEAHNRLLGVMCETGLVGLAAYLSMWAAYLVTVVRAIRQGALAPLGAAALIGAGLGHFVQSLFAFDTPATLLTTFLVFAVATATVASLQPASGNEAQSPVAPDKWIPFGAVPALMVAVVLFGSVLPGIASAYTKRATVALGQRNLDEMLALLTRSQRLATPYHDDQLIVITRTIMQLAKAKKLDGWSQRMDALRLAQTIADQHFAQNKAHVRLRRVYANMLLMIGKTYNSPRVLDRAEALLRQNLLDSPRRQIHLMDYAQFCAETGRLQEAEEWYRQAVALDPSMGGPRWELGKFIWNHLKRSDEGAKLMADSCLSYSQYKFATDQYAPTKAMEWQQLAQACVKTGQTEKLREIVYAVRDFAKTDRPTEVHLGIARYMEKSALFTERDQVLRLARERNPTVARVVDPVLAGKTRLLDVRANNQTKPQEQPTTQPGLSLAQAP